MTSVMKLEDSFNFDETPTKMRLPSTFETPPKDMSETPSVTPIKENTIESIPENVKETKDGRESIRDKDNSNIKVICRFRPDNEMERKRGENIATFPNDASVLINDVSYTFDRVFGPESTQTDVYQFSISQTVDDLLNGYNGTVLAYGQTGSGKSYTMLGTSINDSDGRGVIPRISREIFNRIQQSLLDIEYTVGVSYMEIHLEQIKDLIDVSNNSMGDQRFQIHEDKHNGIYVKGLSQAFVSSPEELNHILLEGLKVRASVSTLMNAESSRSHAIFQIKLNQKHLSLGIIKKSHLFLVDLAGSEKVDKTGAQGQTLEEAKKINSSLSSLGNVINALTDGKLTHIPYRDSKLTRILQESLGGNSRTSLIINCSPSSFNEAETISTLRFGTRAKSITNKAHINTELSATTLRQKLLQLEKINESNQTYIKQLELELNQWRTGERTESPFKANTTKRYSDTSYLVSQQQAQNQQLLQLRNSMITPRTPPSFQIREFQIKEFSSKLPAPSNIPMPSQAPLLKLEEVERRDRKINELENTLLTMKMTNLRHSHTEESKLFTLENNLNKLNGKLNDVELINVNLRKHLLISEKIIENRDVKINKLKLSLKEQQMVISKETLGFRHKLGDIQEKLNVLNKEKQADFVREARESLIRESMYSMDSARRDSMFHFDNKTKETILEEKFNFHSFSQDEITKVNETEEILEEGEEIEDGIAFRRLSAMKSDATIPNETEAAKLERLRIQRRTSKDSPLPPLPPKMPKATRKLELDDDLPECNLDDIDTDKDKSPEADLSNDNLSLNDEKGSNSDTLASSTEFEGKTEIVKRVSLIDKKFPRASVSSNKTSPLEDPILNFHQEYLSIGEFLAESRKRTSLIETIRHSVTAPSPLEDSSETSGMFASPPASPKGINLKIAKPLRGGNLINLFQSQ